MPRKRRKLRTRVLVGRERMTDAMESFLSGDDAVFDEQCSYKGLVDALHGEKVFTECTAREPVDFTEREQRRLDRLEEHYRALRLKEDHERYREMATKCHVLKRYEILLKEPDCDPSSAFSQAIGPGPNSIVRDVPKDRSEKDGSEN